MVSRVVSRMEKEREIERRNGEVEEKEEKEAILAVVLAGGATAGGGRSSVGFKDETRRKRESARRTWKN